MRHEMHEAGLDALKHMRQGANPEAILQASKSFAQSQRNLHQLVGAYERAYQIAALHTNQKLKISSSAWYQMICEEIQEAIDIMLQAANGNNVRPNVSCALLSRISTSIMLSSKVADRKKLLFNWLVTVQQIQLWSGVSQSQIEP